jgi:hypothetical protein
MVDVIRVRRSQTWIAWSANRDHRQQTQLSGENHVVERRLFAAVVFRSGIQTRFSFIVYFCCRYCSRVCDRQYPGVDEGEKRLPIGLGPNDSRELEVALASGPKSLV